MNVWCDAHVGNWGNVAFDSRNAILAAGAIRADIGVFNSVVDVFLGMVKLATCQSATDESEGGPRG